MKEGPAFKRLTANDDLETALRTFSKVLDRNGISHLIMVKNTRIDRPSLKDLFFIAAGTGPDCQLLDRRMREAMEEFKACAQCNGVFDGANCREDKVFCSDGCRQKAHRLSKLL